MNIQNIQFPVVGHCTVEELYFRKNLQKKDFSNNVFFDNEVLALHFSKDGIIHFDTYFNSFSIEKWTKYTILENVALNLSLRGKFIVRLIQKKMVNDNIFEKVVVEKIVSSTERNEFQFSYDGAEKRGLFAFSLKSIDADGFFYGGYYTTDVAEERKRKVKLGIGICTYKREKFIEKNLEILQKEIIGNKQSPLNGGIELFISDNGHSLDAEKLASEYVHIFPNRNLGGVGGFTRTLIEMRSHNELGITHALLMDDDITIEPEALVKTYHLLTLLKDEYKDAFIGGAMLRLDFQNIQVESGAVWNGGRLKSLKNGLDLNLCDNVLLNEIEEYREFNAWWYCCFPLSVVRDDNLPLPIFIRGDDVEYGLRNIRQLILMNGICVWHEPFEYKYSSFLEYYIMRNQLIDNAFHCSWYKAHHAKLDMLKHCMRELFYYRYKNIDLYLRGIRDYLRGPLWLAKQDGESLHKKVMAAGYKAVPVENCNIPFNLKQYEKNSQRTKPFFIRFLCTVLLNGLFLPANGTAIVQMSSPHCINCWRKNRILHYDATTAKAFETQKSIIRSILCIFKMLGICLALDFRMIGVKKRWRTQGMRLRTIEFWKDYLGI